MEPSHILSLTKQFLLSLIPQTSPASVSSIQLRQVSDPYQHFFCPFDSFACFCLVSGCSLSPAVQTWTQSCLQLSPCTWTPTASALRSTSSDLQSSSTVIYTFREVLFQLENTFLPQMFKKTCTFYLPFFLHNAYLFTHTCTFEALPLLDYKIKLFQRVIT